MIDNLMNKLQQATDENLSDIEKAKEQGHGRAEDGGDAAADPALRPGDERHAHGQQ
jgi:hypothetical protein